MSMHIVHFFAVELSTMLGWMFAALRGRPMVAVAVVECVIHMSMEVMRSMKPWSSTDEYATVEPLRTVVTIRRTSVGGNFVIAIRTNGRRTYVDGDLSWCTTSGHKEQTGSGGQQNQ